MMQIGPFGRNNNGNGWLFVGTRTPQKNEEEELARWTLVLFGVVSGVSYCRAARTLITSLTHQPQYFTLSLNFKGWLDTRIRSLFVERVW